MKRSTTTAIGACLAVLLGALWVFFGLAKALDLVGPSITSAETWSAQFSPAALWAVTVAELCIGLRLAFRPAQGILIAALALLGLFTAAFVLWPLQPQQSCGCAGSSGAALGLDGVSPFVRLAALGAVHLLAVALLSSAGPRTVGSPALSA